MPPDNTPQPAGLIRSLYIQNEDVAGRDDAAMDLWEYDEPEAEQALIAVGSDPKAEPEVVGSCGESLKEIWRRQKRLPVEVLKQLRPEALGELRVYIQEVRPDLLDNITDEGYRERSRALLTSRSLRFVLVCFIFLLFSPLFYIVPGAGVCHRERNTTT